jgi:hypothetical protein
VGLGAVNVEDLGVELGRGPDAAVVGWSACEVYEHLVSQYVPNVAMDDLAQGVVSTFRHDVEALGLNAGVAQGLPLQVRVGEFGEGRLLGLLGYRLDGRGAIDRLLGARNIGEPVGGEVSLGSPSRGA